MMVAEVKLSDAHQSGSMSDLLDDSIMTEVLQGEPERQRSQLRHWLAGGQTCCQRLSQKKKQGNSSEALQEHTGHKEQNRIQDCNTERECGKS